MSKLTTSKYIDGYFIRVDNVQSGWSIDKINGKWCLTDFDGNFVFEGKTKKECLSHYKTWYTDSI